MSLVVAMAGLLWAAVGADEYVGASMPQYGVGGAAVPDYSLQGAGDGFDEYRGHAAEAAAPLDYKYDDVAGNSDSPMNDIESDIWKKPSRKQRDGLKRQSGIEEESETENAGEESEVKPIRRAGRRQHSRSLDEANAERRLRRGRRRGVDAEASPPLVDYESRYRNNNKMREEDAPYSKREVTERIIRRKPRDRYVRPAKSDEMDFDEDLESGKRRKDVLPMEYPRVGDSGHRDWSGGETGEMTKTRPRTGGGNLGMVPMPPDVDEPTPPEIKRSGPLEGPVMMAGGGGRRLPSSDLSMLASEEDEDLNERMQPEGRPAALPSRTTADEQRPRGRGRQRNYNDYNDNYYDMKRVQNIKNKLPSLLRRSSTRARGAVVTRSATSTTPTGPAAAELLEMLYPARRVALHTVPAPTTEPATPPAPTTPPSPSSTMQALVTRSTTNAKPTRVKFETTEQLTLLERSRLSILKKAQKKEGAAGREASNKPPVLLQVTSKMPTVVMVEPPTSPEPWRRARAAPAHSPAQLEQVKRLMRRKLIANARSIQDLTDNWDDLVCDYIDTALLDASQAAATALPHLAYAVFFILIILQ